jgi:GT2 family glycosyltransferase
VRRHGAIETSVLVVTDDHPPDLERYARALLAQREAGPYEIVLVDVIGSTDYASAFAEIAAGLDDPPPCRFLRLPGAGRARGCNAARDAASPDASLVVFFADDFIAPARLVAAHRAFHRERPEAETVGIGAALLPEAIANDPFARWLEASGELYGAPFHHGMTGIPSDFFYVGNASVKRAFLERAGRSDDRFRHHAVDDHELGVRLLRLGMRAGYVADALAEHCHPVTLRERREVMRRAGEAARIYETTHGTHPSWRRVLSRAPWRHRLDAWRYRVRHALTGSTRQRERYFRSLLRESLSAGYREARRDA